MVTKKVFMYLLMVKKSFSVLLDWIVFQGLLIFCWVYRQAKNHILSIDLEREICLAKEGHMYRRLWYLFCWFTTMKSTLKTLVHTGNPKTRIVIMFFTFVFNAVLWTCMQWYLSQPLSIDIFLTVAGLLAMPFCINFI